MTINDVLHTLWTDSVTSGKKLDKRQEKLLWMALQRFVEHNGGRQTSAASCGLTGFDMTKSQRGSGRRKQSRIRRACNSVRGLLRFLP